MNNWVNSTVVLAINELRQKIHGKSIAIMMNSSAMDNDGKLLIDRIVEEKWADVLYFFGMEHGIRGDLFAGDSKIEARDRKTGVPVVNLYQYPNLNPPVDYIEKVDAVVFCAQDVGIRHWTYTPWMMSLLKQAAAAKREVIILDRPNPIRGDIVEGEMAKKYVGQSLVSGFEYPLRHGMTVGELALMYRAEKKLDVEITVLKAEGWTVNERLISIDELGEALKNGTLTEAWGCGTAAVVSPIGELFYKGQHFEIGGGKIGEVTQMLYDELTGIQYGRCPDPYGWTAKV